MMKRYVGVLVAAWVWASSSMAMESPQAEMQVLTDNASVQMAPQEATPTAFDPVAHKRVTEVSEQLRCLVCQNQSIAESNAELAVDLRNQVIKLVKDGKTNQEIIDFMVARYGDFVLYKPPVKSTTLILWAGPAVLFILAMMGFIFYLRKRNATVKQTLRPLTEEEKRQAQAILKDS